MTLSDPIGKARVYRNIKTLKEQGYNIIVATPYHCSMDEADIISFVDPKKSINNEKNAAVKFIKKFFYHTPRFILFLLEIYGPSIFLFWRVRIVYGIFKRLRMLKLSLILVENVELLPLALRLRDMGSMRVVVDLRDFYWRNEALTIRRMPDATLRSVMSRLSRWMDRKVRRRIYVKCLHLADTVICVSEGHARQLYDLMGIKAHVVRSTPHYHAISPTLNLNRTNIKLLYHGAALRERSLDLLIEAVKRCRSDFSLHLYLTNPQRGYLDELRMQANDRIFFYEPVPYDQLIQEMNQYDVGLVFFPPLNTTLEHVLPNKFFEYIQSRLAVVSGPSFDMERIIRHYGIGRVTKDFSLEGLVACIESFDQNAIREMKLAAERLAHEFCFESEVKRLRIALNGADDPGTI